MENHGKIMELCFWISVGTLNNSGRALVIVDVNIYIKILYGRCPNISNTSCLSKRHRQTAQTQIRLLLFAILTRTLWIQALITNILFETWKRKRVRNFRTFAVSRYEIHVFEVATYFRLILTTPVCICYKICFHWLGPVWFCDLMKCSYFGVLFCCFMSVC